MTRAAAPRPPAAHAPPLSLLVDFDGTISRLDIGDTLLARFVEPAAVAAVDERYAAGLVGSREVLAWDMDVLPDDPALLRRLAADIPLDPSFGGFVSLARAAGLELEVVSDGLGFPVLDGLERAGLVDLPVATNENRLHGGGAGLVFPYGHPSCFVCGTCKRARVRAHQAVGRAVIFIGDGASDRYAAFHADLVFAKDQLADLCRDQGWAHRPWTDFEALTAWLREALDDGQLPRRTADLEAWRRAHPSAAALDLAAGGSGFICGPEAWGPDRATPGPDRTLSRP